MTTLYRYAAQTEAAFMGWRLTRFKASLDGPLVVVGSGSAFAVAQLWSRLHERGGQPAWAMTPQGFLERPSLPGTRCLLLSVSGRHHDTLAAARKARERGHVYAVLYDRRAPLARLIRGGGEDNGVFVLPQPPTSEGFADPTAMVGMIILAAHVYGGWGPWACHFEAPQIPTLPEAAPPRTLTALGAGLAAPAARIFAHVMRKSGFAFARQTDLRDFSHGDFMVTRPEEDWLAQFSTAPQRDYARKALELLPPEATRLHFSSEHVGLAGAMDLLAQALAAASALMARISEAQRPTWASRLYTLPL